MENGGPQHTDLRLLIEKYATNTCSKEELVQLLALADHDSGKLSEALKVQWNLAKENTISNDEQASRLFEAMMDEAKQIEHGFKTSSPESKQSKPSPVRTIRKRLWIRVASVAAIFVLLFTAAVFIITNDQHQITEATKKKPPVGDVGPGGNRAILTLGNGSKIVLDTAANGALAQQGGMKVIKSGGQLSYNAAGNETEILYNVVTTPKGGQFQLQLEDGSKVWLNAASSLRFPTAFREDERVVELTGEGYFEIAHNAKMPFHVKVKDVDVSVLGTHFNINSYSDEPIIKTTLLEGRVMMKKEEKYVYLDPGQQALITEGSSSIHVVRNVDVDEAVAWKNGFTQFSGADLGVVMRNISRWYNVETSYSNVQSAHLSGKVSRNLKLSQVIKVLEESGIEVKMEGRKLTATPKP